MKYFKSYYSFCQKIAEHNMRRKESYGTVLMFHQVNDDKNEWNNQLCSISQKSFSQLIEGLAGKGYYFRSIVDIENNKAFKRKNKDVFITFDDAYQDVYTNCYSLLSKYSIPFAVFMTVDYLDKPKYLSTKMLCELKQSSLCTIGAHSITHRMLRTLSVEDAMREISESKMRLSELIGDKIDYFAYPFGSYYACSKANIREVERAGYRIAFSTINSDLSSFSFQQRFFLPRRNVNENNYKSIMEK